MKFKDLLGRQLLFFDGGMGTMLQASGMQPGEIPEYWNMEKPEIIEDIHYRYFCAGADVVETNTFGANPVKMDQGKYTSAEIMKKAVSLVKSAAERCSRETGRTDLFTAASIGPTGKLLEPVGDLSFDDAYEGFRVLAVAAEEAGADVILIETMTDSYEIKAAVLAAKENTSLPVIVTAMLDESGRLLTGGDIRSLNAMLEGLRVDAAGLNCGFGPEQIARFVPEYVNESSLPLLINPNAGMPQTDSEGNTVWTLSPEDFADTVAGFAEEGAFLLGGCCGTTPDHIRALAEKAAGTVPPALTVKERTVVSSGSSSVLLDDGFAVIGEKVNPTGNRPVKEALKSGDMSSIVKLAQDEEQSGAAVLDVNVGLPEIDEVSVLCQAVREIQSVVSVPLMIDSSDAEAMEKALRYYNGKPFINSVSGTEESLSSVLPLCAKYGGVLIALTLDDSGIPHTSEKRVAIAEKIIDRAAQYGISRKDIVVDPLTLTVSAEPDAARVTLETVEKLTEMGIKTCLGISNISFGLPAREIITSAFFTMALQKGLSAAIMNPFSERMMDVIACHNALTGKDPNSASYIARFENRKTVTSSSVSAASSSAVESDRQMDLKKALVRGLKKEAYNEAQLLADQGTDPLVIVNDHIIPALDQVGAEYEKGKVYLPQLLMTAEAAQEAFIVVKALIEKSGSGESVSKGKIVIATVKGDIHDIGKNIVRVLLENYGYEVIDLGKDVSPEDIIDAAEKEKVQLIGLSALMTTTVPNMEATIRLAKERGLDCRFAVGGAVLNESYADMIGADCYCRDAMATVKYAEQLYSR